MPVSYGVTSEQRYTAAPTVTGAGTTYYNTTSSTLWVSNGSAWVQGLDTVSGVTLGTVQTITAQKTISVTTGTNALALTTGTNAIGDTTYMSVLARAIFGYDNQNVVIGDNGSSKPIQFRSGATNTSGDAKLSVSVAAGIVGTSGVPALFQGASTFSQVTASTIPLVVKANASPTASLTEWQNSAGTTVYAAMTSLGVMNINNTAVVSTYNAAAVPVVVKGGASQTADLTQWQNNAGTALTKVLAGGELNITMPAGTTDAMPSIFTIRGVSGQFYKQFFRIEQSDGTELTSMSSGIQSWWGGVFSTSWDFWSGSTGANTLVRGGTTTQSSLRVTRDVLSAANMHVAEFGTRDYSGAGSDTINAFVTKEGDASFKTVTVTTTTPTAAGHLASKSYVDGLLEVAIQASQPANSFDLWVDTDETGVAVGTAPYAWAAGTISITATTVATAAGTINFPAGRFTQAPIVTCQIMTSTAQWFVTGAAPTTSVCTVTICQRDGATASGTLNVHWIAVQMTASASAG